MRDFKINPMGIAWKEWGQKSVVPPLAGAVPPPVQLITRRTTTESINASFCLQVPIFCYPLPARSCSLKILSVLWSMCGTYNIPIYQNGYLLHQTLFGRYVKCEYQVFLTKIQQMHYGHFKLARMQNLSFFWKHVAPPIQCFSLRTWFCSYFNTSL